MPITKDKSKEYERLHSEEPNIKQFLTDDDKHYYLMSIGQPSSLTSV